MKIVAISIIRNEADILETFVRYHLQIVDQMIVINHRSADSSSKILHDLKGEGLSIEVLEETSIEQPQGRALTRIMNKAVYDYNADWILPLDADEFLTACDEEKIRKILEEASDDKIINVPWRTYVPVASDSKELNVLKRIQHYRNIEDPQYYKVIVPRSIALKNAAILPGNHAVVRNTFFRKRKKLPTVLTDQLVLSHFPVRSSNQIITKAFVGWLSNLAKPDKGKGEAFHLKQLYDRFKEGNKVLPEELTEMAMGYATKSGDISKDLIFKPIIPQIADFELKYTAIYECNPVQVLAQSAEELAEAFASFRRERNVSIWPKLTGRLK